MLVKVIQVKSRRIKFFQAGREDRSLQRGHRSLKGWRDEGEVLMLHVHFFVHADGVRNEVCVELEQILTKKFSEVFWQFIGFLQT